MLNKHLEVSEKFHSFVLGDSSECVSHQFVISDIVKELNIYIYSFSLCAKKLFQSC